MDKAGAGTQLELVMFESGISDTQQSDVSPVSDIQVIAQLLFVFIINAWHTYRMLFSVAVYVCTWKGNTFLCLTVMKSTDLKYRCMV